MKRFIWITLLAFASVCHAQTVRLGDVNMRDVVVVTNEQDLAALTILNESNAVLVAQITGLYASNATVFASVGALELGTNGWNAAALLAGTAWQNPAAATNWTWTSNGKEITLTGYSGPAAVVIPDMLDGLPVTGFGEIFRGNQNITSVSGGRFITTIGDYAFSGTSLTTSNFPQAITIGNYAFAKTSLTTANFPQVTTIGNYAFGDTQLTASDFPQVTTIGKGAFVGTSLTSVSLPQATTIGEYAFANSSLTSLYLGQNAPAEAPYVFDLTTNAIVYVTDPTATGWGAMWNGRPVVRMPLFADTLTLKGTNVEDRITAKVNAATAPLISTAVADAKYVAKAGFPSGGCTDLGTATNLVIDGTSVYYTAAPASAYTITVSQPVSSGYTYCLTTYSDSPITLVNADLRNDWVLAGTNTLVFYPGTTNRWLVKGSAP